MLRSSSSLPVRSAGCPHLVSFNPLPRLHPRPRHHDPSYARSVVLSLGLSFHASPTYISSCTFLSGFRSAPTHVDSFVPVRSFCFAHGFPPAPSLASVMHPRIILRPSCRLAPSVSVSFHSLRGPPRPTSSLLHLSVVPPAYSYHDSPYIVPSCPRDPVPGSITPPLCPSSLCMPRSIPPPLPPLLPRMTTRASSRMPFSITHSLAALPRISASNP
ncbi:hypothetical protein C8R44DRAFT_885532 [Mycena epipterygia]|nr:hypothetical protein C8R44DRAFT_885532 [Mycena epipterygia]